MKPLLMKKPRTYWRKDTWKSLPSGYFQHDPVVVEDKLNPVTKIAGEEKAEKCSRSWGSGHSFERVEPRSSGKSSSKSSYWD